jgi:anaerobic magnesium-protoporphyrin IX monomethyl ester cyclase
MTKLDCLLISPPNYYADEPSIWNAVDSNFPALGLIDLAAYAHLNGKSVKIIDCNIVAPAVDIFEKHFQTEFVNKYNKIHVIGLTAVTATIKKAYKIAEICKKHYPDTKIVFGGVHATFMTDEVIAHPVVDMAVVGEGELTLADILNNVPLEQIDGLVYKKDGNIIRNRPRDRILDLDAMPMPYYSLLPIESYRPAKGSYKRLPAMAMMTSRGCPGRCTFCNKTLGSMLVHKSAKTIFKEMLYLNKVYGIKQIMFYDDTFTVFRDNVNKLCDLIKDNKLDISWTCFARVDYIDLLMLKNMKSAGCHQIMYGVENIDERVLNNINKHTNVDQIRNAIKLTKEAGIECRAAFMVGNPGDSPEVVEKNIKFIREVGPDLLIVNITTPFPGTAMYKWADERGLLLTKDWDDYTLAKPVVRLENLTETEIKDLYKRMYRSFYFRPKYILKKAMSIRSIEDIKVLSSGFNAVVGFLGGNLITKKFK